jgi:glucose/arabinose dehydrogenase
MDCNRVASQRSMLAAWLFAGSVFAFGVSQDVQAANLPTGFQETKLIGSINPSCVEIAPDGRVFLCEKSGRIRVYKDNKWLTAPLLTVDADFQEERGLLGLALDPDFRNNPYVYLYYTVKNPAHNRVSRFRIEGDVATGAETVLLDLNNLAALRSGGWHNGGTLRFAKDGKLMIAAGNNAIQANSQSFDNLLGKILRINSDGSIPDDNPFYKTTTGNNRAIWALGLRNPFSGDVNPATGRFVFNDVGDGSFEEINEAKAGFNYGYPKTEGHAGTAPTGLTGTYGDPVSWYSHGDGCAIAGATFYHPIQVTFGADYLDAYFFSDYCNGWIKSMSAAAGSAVKPFATGINRPIYLKTAPDGSLYYVSRGARAAGLASGSGEDNSSTNDGSLFRVTGPIPISVTARRAGPETVTAFISQGRIQLPAGKRSVALYDLSGNRVWEYHGAAAGNLAGTATWLTLPADMPLGAYRARFN